MIHLDLKQGTPEWDQVRIGIPTASKFDKIVTPAKLQPSTQAGSYMNQILAEWLLGMKLEFGEETQYAERGTHMEPEARAFYEFKENVEVVNGGFVLRDDRKVGGSPDGLVGDEGGVELKCPAIHTHIGYMLNSDLLVAKYNFQVQGYMYLTDRAWWDVQSYNPTLPRVIRRVERDEKHIAALHAGLTTFVQYLDEAKAQLESFKHRPELVA